MGDFDATRRREQRQQESRVFGWHACEAVFLKRPEAIRKVYVQREHLHALRPLIAHCVANRIGYRLLDEADLEKLTKSQHHEGLCLDVARSAALRLDEVLADIPDGAPAWLAWLDGVGNPHNLGAILRTAAHFGCKGVLVPEDGGLALSGAACRVAEGGAEYVPLIGLADASAAQESLRVAGFTLVGTVVRDGDDVFAEPLPVRLVLVMGAEEQGMSEAVLARCDRRVMIPGSGDVESLNVSAAFAVFAAQYAAAVRSNR